MIVFRYTVVVLFAFATASAVAGDSKERRSAETWAHLMRKGLVELPGRSPEEIAYQRLWEEAYTEMLLSRAKIEKLEGESKSSAARAQIHDIRAKMDALEKAVEALHDQVQAPVHAMLDKQFRAIEGHEIYRRFRNSRFRKADDKKSGVERALEELAQEAHQLIGDMTLLRKRHGAALETDEVGRAISERLAALRLNALTALAIVTEGTTPSGSRNEKQSPERERRALAKKIVLAVSVSVSIAEIAAAIYIQTDKYWTAGALVGAVGIVSLVATIANRIINWHNAKIHLMSFPELAVGALFPPFLFVKLITKTPGFAAPPRASPRSLLEHLLYLPELSDNSGRAANLGPEVERLAKIYMDGLGSSVMLGSDETAQEKLIKYTRFLTFYFTEQTEIPAELSEVEALHTERCRNALESR